MNNLRIETVNIHELTLDPTNARLHNQGNISAIAGSLKLFGQRKPLVITGGNIVVAGNGTLEAAKSLGWKEISIVRTPTDWTPEQVKAYALADNRTSEMAEWDSKILAEQLLELDAVGWDVAEFGFEPLAPPINPQLLEEDEIPTPPVDPISKLGNIWQLDEHRVMCGDSTNMEHVARLTNGRKAVLLHADPPYGMGKENDGVLNDNLYADKLDAFQMLWWKTWRKHLEDNASAYIWGNAFDLWRLWWVGGLNNSEPLTFRNEAVWSKPAGFGQNSELQRQYSSNTERVLFFMLGEQGFNNDADNYWTGWEPIRSYLNNERIKSGLTTDQCNKICGKQNMTQSAFTKGGFRLILRKDYEKLRDASKGIAFKQDYDVLKQDYDALKQEFFKTRAFFDNVHENMNEVWQAPRVAGEERHGHATPKPLELMQRVMKSSAPHKGLVFEPFGGSGSTLIGAEQTGRICYTMELTAAYVDVIVKRWENLTGKKAELLES